MDADRRHWLLGQRHRTLLAIRIEATVTAFAPLPWAPFPIGDDAKGARWYLHMKGFHLSRRPKSSKMGSKPYWFCSKGRWDHYYIGLKTNQALARVGSTASVSGAADYTHPNTLRFDTHRSTAVVALLTGCSEMRAPWEGCPLYNIPPQPWQFFMLWGLLCGM